MTNIKKTTEVAVPASRAWALIGKPGSISNWHPAIASSPTEGTRRQCVLADGAKITEEIRAHDDAQRSYTYAIVDSPLPVKDYVATLRVTEAGPDRCVLEWSGSYEPLGPAEDIEAMIAGVYEAGLSAAAQELQN